MLIDEVLTPDSSRFWPADIPPGTSPPSFDKQFVRDYLETLDWNKKAPGPRLPDDVIEQPPQLRRSAAPAHWPRAGLAEDLTPQVQGSNSNVAAILESS